MDPVLKLLVVEDHDDLREATVAALAAMGHVVKGVGQAEAIDDELGRFVPDIVLLDIQLPGEDGLSVARRLRRAMPSLGIIMVTAMHRSSDVAVGYSAGADIYVTKPAAPLELHAAVLALARRLRPTAAAEGVLQLSLQALQVKGQQGQVEVSDNDGQVLAALAKAVDQRLETWQLLELMGKAAEETEKKALAVQMVRLRKKLEAAGAPEPTIKAIRGSGYQLCVGLKVVR